ncbi:MAG: membrane protein insertase YidC [bacterium]|jgi:YidC/Oxa1 family membrane protein insertase
MNQQSRFLLAISLMILVLVTTNILFPPVPPDESVSQELEEGASLEATGPESLLQEAPQQGLNLFGEEPALDPFRSTPTAGQEQTVKVSGPLYEMTFSAVGARLVSAKLLRFTNFYQEGTVELLDKDGPGALSSRIEVSGGELDLAEATYQVVPEGGITLEEGGPAQSLAFGYVHPSGAFSMTTSYVFDPSSYEVAVTTSMSGPGVERALLVTEMGTGLAYNELRVAEESRVLGYAAKHSSEGIQADYFRKIDEEETLEGPFEWLALKSKYFIFAILPGSEEAGAEQYLGAVSIAPSPGEDQAEITVAQAVSGNGTVDYRLFLGPQERPLLTGYGNELEEANPYGYRWMRVVVRPVVAVVLSLLNFLHDKLNVGYGWVLIFFGCLMRLLLFPVNQRAMRSQMKNMAVQPLLQDIQTKYKDQPEKLQKEMVKLYKDHGFNPMAGCLPMLLPWPVLITLFFVFQNTIQLRGESFLWLPNLSAADPLHILPVVMGLSMFFLQWISVRSMPTPNPQMKIMMWLMPIMMTGIFFNFASGLNLYYATANIATIPQQYLIAKERKALKEGPASGQLKHKDP